MSLNDRFARPQPLVPAPMGRPGHEAPDQLDRQENEASAGRHGGLRGRHVELPAVHESSSGRSRLSVLSAALRVRYDATSPRIRWTFAICCLVAALALAVASTWSPSAPPIENLLERATPTGSDATQPNTTPLNATQPNTTPSGPMPSPGGTSPDPGPKELHVHAAGAVVRPGLVTVAAGARVDDVVRAAGGLGFDADPDSVNLAALVHDGERVVVPHRGKPVPTLAEAVAVDPAPNGPTVGIGLAAPQIDLNSATVEQLDTLPGVGPATAAKILDYRTRHGRFRSVTELLEVPGIGESKLTSLRARVRV